MITFACNHDYFRSMITFIELSCGYVFFKLWRENNVYFVNFQGKFLQCQIFMLENIFYVLVFISPQNYGMAWVGGMKTFAIFCSRVLYLTCYLQLSPIYLFLNRMG